MLGLCFAYLDPSYVGQKIEWHKPSLNTQAQYSILKAKHLTRPAGRNTKVSRLNTKDLILLIFFPLHLVKAMACGIFAAKL